MWVQDLHNSGRTFWYYCSPVCGSSTQGVQDWFYCDCAPPTVLLRILLCLWTWGFVWFVCFFFFFGDFQHPPVDGCSTDRCNFGALGGGNEHRSFYSTVWNQKPCGWYLQLGKGPQLRLRWKILETARWYQKSPPSSSVWGLHGNYGKLQSIPAI